MTLRARVAAVAAIAGRLRAEVAECGVVWTDRHIGQAWAAGLATDCHVEDVLVDGTEVWRVEMRPRRSDDDLGEVFDASGQRAGALERAPGGMFTVRR